MKPKLLRAVGIVFLIFGVLGFLFASVGLSSAEKAFSIQSPKGIEIVLPADAPEVLARKRQAGAVLYASLLLGGVGAVLFIAGIVAGRRNQEVADHTVRGR